MFGASVSERRNYMKEECVLLFSEVEKEKVLMKRKPSNHILNIIMVH